MHWHLLDLLPVALLIVSCVGARPVRPLCDFNNGYLSPDTGSALRGILAIMVILHHLALGKPLGVLFGFFYFVGFLAVAFFFFLSGFGLMKSYLSKETYRYRFLVHRTPKIIVPYIILATVFYLFNAVNGTPVSVKSQILTTFKGSPLVPHSWYIFCILAFYCIFLLLMTLCKKHYFMIIIGTCAWYVIYTVFCIKMQYGSWWFRTFPLLIFGMIWALYEEKLLKILQRYYRIIAPVVWLTFCVLFYFFESYFNSSIPAVSYIFVVLYCAFFIVSVLTITLKVKIGNPILSFLGKNSLEIYLAQGLFIEGLRSNILFIKSDFIWSLLSVLGSVALGSVLHRLTSVITRKIR